MYAKCEVLRSWGVQYGSLTGPGEAGPCSSIAWEGDPHGIGFINSLLADGALVGMNMRKYIAWIAWHVQTSTTHAA
jgi:hypothetical protein